MFEGTCLQEKKKAAKKEKKRKGLGVLNVFVSVKLLKNIFYPKKLFKDFNNQNPPKFKLPSLWITICLSSQNSKKHKIFEHYT